jgi:hypothetical protein
MHDRVLEAHNSLMDRQEWLEGTDDFVCLDAGVRKRTALDINSEESITEVVC